MIDKYGLINAIIISIAGQFSYFNIVEYRMIILILQMKAFRKYAGTGLYDSFYIYRL